MTATAEHTYVRRTPCCSLKPRVKIRETGRIYECHRCGRRWRMVLDGIWLKWEAVDE